MGRVADFARAQTIEVAAGEVFRGVGLGSSLVDHLDGWAAARGLAALTLTTYRDVPWNGPYYERLGSG